MCVRIASFFRMVTRFRPFPSYRHVDQTQTSYLLPHSSAAKHTHTRARARTHARTFEKAVVISAQVLCCCKEYKKQNVATSE